MKAYPSWQAFQDHLPLRNRMTSDIHCQEEYIYYHDVHMHVDIYQPRYFKGTIIILHGLIANGRMLSFLAVPFYRLGYRVICPDLPFFGQSNVKQATYEDWLACCQKLIEQTEIENTFLMGLGLSGMLAYQLGTLCPQIRGVIVTHLLDFNDKNVENDVWLDPVFENHARLLRWRALKIKRVIDTRTISNNPAVCQLLSEDEQSAGAKVTQEFLHTLAHPTLCPPEDYRVPILWVQPEMDQWIDPADSMSFYERIGADKYHVLLEGAGHLPIEVIGLNQLQKMVVLFIRKYRL